MKLFFCAAAIALALAAGSASAAEPIEKDAIAMTERGVALMKSKGKDAMIKAINAKDPDFVQGSLDIYMRDLKSGVVVAHPVNPSLVGKDLTDVPDAAGKNSGAKSSKWLPRAARAGSPTCTGIRPTKRSSRRPLTSCAWTT